MTETAHQFCSNKSKKKAENAHKKTVSFKPNRPCRTFLILLKKLSFCLYYVYLLTHVMYTCYINLKVSGNPSDDHNLASIVFKKALLQLFFISLYIYRLETMNENWKLWFMNHSLDISSSELKFALSLVYFMKNFELQLQEATKFFSYFWLQFVKIKSRKKPYPRFLIMFLLFWDIGLYYIFVSLKSELKIENPS